LISVFSSQRIGRRGQSAMVDCSRIFFVKKGMGHRGSGMGHRGSGMGHGAWGMGHGAWGMGHGALPNFGLPDIRYIIRCRTSFSGRSTVKLEKH